MMCSKSRNHTNMMAGKHRIQAFKVAIIILKFLLLSFDVSIPKCIFLIIFGQVIYPNILECRLLVAMYISRLFTKGWLSVLRHVSKAFH